MLLYQEEGGKVSMGGAGGTAFFLNAILEGMASQTHNIGSLELLM